MSNQMLLVGNVIFSIDGPNYDQLTRSTGIEWASQARIGRENALQFTGVGEETITLTGTIYGLFREQGIGQVDKLEGAMRTHAPQLVLSGQGKRYGYYCITDLSEDQTALLDNGAPQKQSYTLTMKKYGEDMLSPDAIMDGDGGGIGGIRV
jgi:phage protein U